MLDGRGRFGLLALVLTAATGALACGPSIDLRNALAVTEVSSGWYDNGLKNGMNHLLPSISFRIRNTGPHPLTNVRITIGFWLEDGRELDSKDVQAIGNQPLAPGATSDLVLVRGETGYTLEQPRAEFFMHSSFRDGLAKLFARRSGNIVPLGEFRLDRQILPNTGPAVPGTE
jgi:hypothetical protein